MRKHKSEVLGLLIFLILYNSPPLIFKERLYFTMFTQNHVPLWCAKGAKRSNKLRKELKFVLRTVLQQGYDVACHEYIQVCHMHLSTDQDESVTFHYGANLNVAGAFQPHRAAITGPNAHADNLLRSQQTNLTHYVCLNFRYHLWSGPSSRLHKSGLHDL